MTNLIKKHLFSIIFLVFFALVFLLSIRPLNDFDIWFHIKSGEIFTKMGIITHDVFSYTALGRTWFPYEWLFQILLYNTQQIFGFDFIKFFIAGLALLQTVLIYVIARKIMKLGSISTLVICIFYFASIFPSIVARPEILAFTFFLINLSLILLFYFQGKNWLILTIPITLLWTNMHGSIFLDIVFFVSYTLIAFVQYIYTKEKTWIRKTKLLGIFTLINFVATILPPLGPMQYQLLWRFFLEKKLISTYIDEWNPLTSDPVNFIIYTTTALAILATWIFVIRKQKPLEYLWLAPLFVLVVTPYFAIRNIYLAMIGLTFILGYTSFYLFTKINKNRFIKIVQITLCIAFVSIELFLLWGEYNFKASYYYPSQAVKFLKTYQLKGNMFNEYAYGGYLLYQLYPRYKVFIDGRTDIYLCCEMPATLDIVKKKNLPDDDFAKYMYSHIWNPYDISFVILRTENHTTIKKITRLLQNDPNWSLVFWDDYTQIYVRKDGKNNDIIKKFGTEYATPYLQNIYIKNHQKQALQEYQRMDSIVKSARTSNAIGFIYLQNKDLVNAAQRFQQAISINPNFESPYMNLAEIEAYQGNLDQAISLYLTAKSIAPDRGLIYIRLGELYMQKNNDRDSAKKYWQEGIDNASDPNDIKTLRQLLSSLPQ